MNRGPRFRFPAAQAAAATVAAVLLGCAPEAEPATGEAFVPRLAPAFGRVTPARTRTLPTVPAAYEPDDNNRVPAPDAEAPAHDEPQPLKVEADAVPDIGRAPLRVQFEARVDAADDTYTCDWEFGDGDTGVGNPVEHEFSTAGSFTAKVRVTGGNGATGAYEVGVEVDAPVGDGEEDGR